MADNRKKILFYYRDGLDELNIEVTLVELGVKTWNGNNTQPFYQTGDWNYSWADDGHTYDQIGIDPTDNLRTLDVGNISTLYLNPSDGAKGITCDQRISDLVGYSRFQFGILYTPGDITAVCNESNSHYSAIYLAHAVVSGDDYYGFLGWGTDPNAWNYRKPMFIVSNEFSRWLAEFVYEPGKAGYKPTNIKYGSDPVIGGKGTNPDPGKNPSYHTDDITNPGVPDESVASIVGAGLINAYKIDKTNLSALSSCLYGTTLGGLITNLSINPLDFIVSLNIFPCEPTTGSSTNVVLGRWVCTDSGIDSLGGNVSGNPLSSQYKVIDFGTVEIPENWGSFLDYTHTEIELYLPFVGVVNIDPAEVMDGNIALSYTIDFLTGMCVANVNCNRTVILPDGRTKYQKSQHSYQGNCAVNVPLSQQQYGNMIGSMINAGVAGMKGGVLGAGISLASDVASGGFKPTVTTKGSITANAGFCSVLYPYVRVVRPISAVSDSFQETMGFPSYIDSTLGACEDLCICDSIDLHTISGATASEIERIKEMCLSGVHV